MNKPPIAAFLLGLIIIAPTFARTIEAVKIDPPTIDGRLDDPVWQQAATVSDLIVYHTDDVARQKTVGYIAYDASHIYIAARCELGRDREVISSEHPHDSGELFRDDHIEVMIDPGHSQTDFYQLAINGAGSTFDCSREHGGSHEDDGWNGEWQGAAHIGDGFYSVELAIPYHNLRLRSDTPSTWGINICRDDADTRELSSLASNGSFNEADKFAMLTNLDVDFARYAIAVGPDHVMYEPVRDPPAADLIVPITNQSGRARSVRIEIESSEGATTQDLTLRDGQVVNLRLDALPVRPVMDGLSDVLLVAGAPHTQRIVVRDAADGTILQVGKPRLHAVCKVMDVQMRHNWRRDMAQAASSAVEMDVTLNLATPHRRRGSLVATLINDAGATVAERRIRQPGETEHVTIDAAGLDWGAYDVRVVFENHLGDAIVASQSKAIIAPGGQHAVRVLNNFVSELMNTAERGIDDVDHVDYLNPRDGWTWISRNGKESMQWLPAGRQTLAINAGDAVIVRAIPELIYCQYPSDPYIEPYGPYDWAFLREHVLDNCNMIVGSVEPDEMAQWRSEGKRWVTHVTVPNLVEKRHFNTQEAYAHWQASEGYSHDLMDGMIADEFLGFTHQQYVDYAKSLSLLRNDPKFDGRQFYAWCSAIYGLDAGRIFMNVLLHAGWHHCFERYLPERKTEDEARIYIDEHLVETARAWERAIPGSSRKAIITLGYMSQPTESLNHYPSVNYRVFMDMQMQALVSEPALFGTYGVMQYLSSYADEEAVRWAGRLYRHYGIEGRTDRLTDEPYINPHLQNGDFDDGVNNWQITAAEDGSVRTDEQAGYSWLQGRYPTTDQGNRFLVMRRSGKAPNSFSQQIVGLEPGKLYSLKMFTGDYNDLVDEISEEEIHAVSIDLDGVEVLPGEHNNFQVMQPNCYSHHVGKFDREYNYWVNYHWRVFRAEGETATITVRDWQSADEPGGPIGQELMFNFVEVQPYFAP